MIAIAIDWNFMRLEQITSLKVLFYTQGRLVLIEKRFVGIANKKIVPKPHVHLQEYYCLENLRSHGLAMIWQEVIRFEQLPCSSSK